MHTLSSWSKETPTERTERFARWYDHYVHEYRSEPTTITVHEICERYGGPEEGGWYFRCGYPVETICIFSRSQAIRVLHELHETYDSEEYEEAVYDICLASEIAQRYPLTRPHYE